MSTGRVPLSSLPDGVILQAGTYIPAAGATASVYQHGILHDGTTQITIYAAETGGTVLAQPVTADANGALPGWVLAEQDLDVVATFEGHGGSGEVVSVRAEDLVGVDSGTGLPALGKGAVPLPVSVALGTLAIDPTVSPYNAAADAQDVSDGVISGGSLNQITSVSGGLLWQAASPVGKSVLVIGGGASFADLWTTISAFDGNQTITLATPAGQAMSRTRVAWGTDDTAKIDGPVATALVANPNLVLRPPAGRGIMYNGVGIGTPTVLYQAPVLIGTRWYLGPGVSLYVSPGGGTPAQTSQVDIQNLYTIGGYGGVRLTYTGANSSTRPKRLRMYAEEFSGAAMSSLSNNEPYWHIDGTARQSVIERGIAVAIAGQMDDNRVQVETLNIIGGVKCGIGNNSRVEVSSVFGSSGVIATSGCPRWQCWQVPTASGSSPKSGEGMVLKMRAGNENLNATVGNFAAKYAGLADFRIVGCSEDNASGTDFSNRQPDYFTASTGVIGGLLVTDSLVCGGGPTQNPVFYTTISNANFWGNRFQDSVLEGTIPNYIVQFTQTPVATTARGSQVARWYPADGQTGINKNCVIASNDPGIYVDDPAQIFVPTKQQYAGAEDLGDYIKLLSTRVRAFTVVNATTINILDDLGGQDAVEITYSSTSGLAYAAFAAPVVGKPCWVEASMCQGASSPQTQIQVLVETTGGSPVVHFQQRPFLPAHGWPANGRFRWLWVPEDASSQLNVMFRCQAGITPGSVDIGRVRCYQAAEPVNTEGPDAGLEKYLLNGGHHYRESFERRHCSTSTLPIASGTMSLVPIVLYRGDVITNLTFMSGNTGLTMGTTPGNFWYALYDRNLNLLAQSADGGPTVAWAAKTPKPLPLSSPQTIPATGLYYAAIMVNFGSGGTPVMPTMVGIASTSNTTAPGGVGGSAPNQVGFPADLPVIAATNGSGLTSTAPAGPLTLAAFADILYCITS